MIIKRLKKMIKSLDEAINEKEIKALKEGLCQ